MKEYIVKVADDEMNEDEMFIGIIRKHEELIRCKDCEKQSTITCPIYKLGYWTKPDGHCYMAERKEE